MWVKLRQTLTEFEFVATKCEEATVFEVLRDYNTALAEMPRSYPGRRPVSALHRIIDRNSHLLSDDPTLFVQQTYNALVWDWGGTTALGRRMRSAARRYRRIWLRMVAPPRVASDPSLARTLMGHDGEVTSVDISEDGAIIVSGGTDKTVRLWDADTGQLQRVLVGHTASVDCVAFSPDGKRVASSSAGYEVRVWDVASGDFERKLGDYSSSMAFSPDGKQIAEGNGYGWILLWDLETGRSNVLIQGQSGERIMVRDEPDLMFSIDAHKTVKRWDAKTGNLRHERTRSKLGQERRPKAATFTAHLYEVTSVVFSPDGNTLATEDSDGTLIVTNLRNKKRERTILTGHKLPGAGRATFSPDGRLLAHVGPGWQITLWDLNTGDCRRTFDVYGTAPLSIAISRNKKFIIAACADGTLKHLDIETGNVSRNRTGHFSRVTSVALSRDDQTVVSGSEDGTVNVWTGTEETGDLVEYGSEAVRTSFAFSARANIVAFGSEQGTVEVLDVTTGEHIRRLQAHALEVNTLALSSDGRFLATVGSRKTVKLWDVASGEFRFSLKNKDLVKCVAIAPDGRHVASATAHRVQVWGVSSGIPEQKLDHFDREIVDVVFSSDARTLATRTSFGDVYLWDLSTMTIRGAFDAGENVWPHSCEISRDGNTLVTASTGKLRLWAAPERLVRNLKHNRSQASCVAIAPNGKMIASGSIWNGTVSLWDAETGDELTQLPGSDRVFAVWFSPDSSELRVANLDKDSSLFNRDRLRMFLNIDRLGILFPSPSQVEYRFPKDK